MSLSKDLFHELQLLSMFPLDSNQQGLKLHHSADIDLVAAAERLYQKGLISQSDGGYLTALGRDAAEHLELTLGVLTAGAVKDGTAAPLPA